jgi:predicted nucleic acid-binding protein
VIYSGLHKPTGVCERILVAGIDRLIELYSIDFAKEELTTNLQRKMGFSRKEIQRIIEALPITWITRDIYQPRLQRAIKIVKTEQDSPFVAASIATGFPLISGDRHMLTVEVKRGIRAYEPREFLDAISS